MTTQDCDAVRDRLVDAFYARCEPAPDDREHAAECSACSALAADLTSISAALSAAPAPRLRAETADAARARARRELHRPPAPVAVPARERPLPAGFARELARLLAVAAAPLPLALGITAAMLHFGAAILTPFVPPVLVYGLGAAYALAAASCLALIYGSIPFVAHRRSLRRESEVTS